jgi:pimeloyl-ACP methyl ester carboxylesterase
VRPSDIEAIADLLGETADATGGVAQETHEAIAQRVFRATGQFGRPTQAVHDRIARSVYSGVRLGLRTGARQAGRAVARSVPADAPALGTRTGEAVALGAIQGFAGDLLERRGSPLATELGIYVDGQRIEPTAEALAAAYPEPRRLAVFVHGLCETEHAWKGLPRPGDQPRHTPFPERMRDDLDATPLLIRFNSGRHISENARDLDALLDDVIEHWPLPVLDLVLVGHSMGGLIVRSAAWQARERPWARLVRHVICLGTPHHGAELEQGAHLLDWALGQTPETRAFSRALRMRSSGIKDLRYGSALEEDWLDQDPDELLRRRAGEVPFLPHAEYCWVSASLTRGAVGRTLGDLLVRTPSASGTGRGQHVPFDLDNGSILHGLTHFDLLDHPAVYEQLLAWFTRPARLPART